MNTHPPPATAIQLTEKYYQFFSSNLCSISLTSITLTQTLNTFSWIIKKSNWFLCSLAPYSYTLILLYAKTDEPSWTTGFIFFPTQTISQLPTILSSFG